jgi:UDP-2-acetamido-2-deoxy-ribo-hexuluronate aminotransferase
MSIIEESVVKPIRMVDVIGQYHRYQSEIDEAILAVVRSGAYINGPAVKQFERNMESYLGVKHAIACASGTDALQVALMSLGIGSGDEVITTPFTFVATTETIGILGAKPVYVEIDPDTFNIDPEQIEAAITSKTKAILPVHLFGQPADMDRILEIAHKYKLPVIEDAAQAVGASWNGKKACSIGTMATISFYPSKNLGAFGDAGMITTNDDKLAAIARSVCNHGASVTYYHDRLGICSRLDSIQAAILDVKLKYLDEWNFRRDEVAKLYTEILAPHSDKIKTPVCDDRATPIWHQYSILLSHKRDEVMAAMKEHGIPTSVYYPLPLHLQPAYSSFGSVKGDFPIAESVSEHILALPMHSELTDEDARYIAEELIHVVEKLSR